MLYADDFECFQIQDLSSTNYEFTGCKKPINPTCAFLCYSAILISLEKISGVHIIFFWPFSNKKAPCAPVKGYYACNVRKHVLSFVSNNPLSEITLCNEDTRK